MRIEPAGLLFKIDCGDLLVSFGRQRSGFVADEHHEILRQPPACPTLLNILISELSGCAENTNLCGRGFKCIATHEFGFVTVGVVFHLTQHEATDGVAYMHKGPKNTARDPDARPRCVENDTDLPRRAAGSSFEP